MSIRPAAPVSDSLYDDDFLAWTEQQVKLLRALKIMPAGIDIENIVEEIETLGRAEIYAVESQIHNILVHLLKIVSAPSSSAAAHWRGEIHGFHVALRRQYLPSMRQRIRLQQEWRSAKQVADALLDARDERLLSGLPEVCPISLPDLIGEDISSDHLCQLLRASARNSVEQKVP